MIQILLTLVCFSCSPAAVGTAQRVEPEKSLKVLSYNIHYGVGMDKKKDLARIANVITRQDPDIVGLQEIGNHAMAEELGRLTGMQFSFGPSLGKLDGYGDAILCKHPFKTLANQAIPSASSSRYQAMAIDVDLSNVFGPHSKVRFVNTHFDWLSTIGSQEARLAAVDVIERAFFTDGDLPAILTGDLNAQPESPPLKKLSSKGWHFESLGKERLTWSSEKPAKQIDYVLIRSKTAWTVTATEVLNEPVASDHLPVLMTLKLNK